MAVEGPEEDRPIHGALPAAPAAALAGVGVALAALAAARSAQAQPMQQDNGLLNGLLAGEYQAIAAYSAAAGILMSPPPGDPLASAAPVVLAVAGHFQSQHRDHAAKLAAMITANGGTPVQESGSTFAPPAGFTATVVNVIKLAANAEKGAAIAYNESLKMMNSATSARVVAAIGGVETQHFVVLYLLANDITQGGFAFMAAMADVQALAGDVVPRSFVTTVGAGSTGLEAVADFTYT